MRKAKTLDCVEMKDGLESLAKSSVIPAKAGIQGSAQMLFFSHPLSEIRYANRTTPWIPNRVGNDGKVANSIRQVGRRATRPCGKALDNDF